MTYDQSGVNDGANSGTNSALHLWVAILLALLLLVLWFMGYGPGGSKCQPEAATATLTAPASPQAVVPSAPPPVEAAMPPPVAVAAAGTAAAVTATTTMAAVAGAPAAKLYFGVDKTDLPEQTDKTLGEVVAYLKANTGTKASVSGFHDPSGSVARNEELALNRARAVRGALEKLGIPKERVAMQKPQQTSGTGKPAEARRVEVSVVR
jgi:K(+)-stimulated pyrophosphate-energized sodium pump